MRRLMLLIVLVAVGTGGWWIWNNQPDVRDAIEQYVENGEFLTLEARYTANQIMEKHRKELLADEQHTFQEPVLKFYPYLLIEAKFAQADKKTREGVILWSLNDGEMILDTDSWDKTHGFEDAINAGATRNDFKIMFALARNGGTLTRDQLQKELNLEPDSFAPLLESTLEKHLIVQNGNEVQLHFQNPKILVSPETKVKRDFVSRPYSQTQRVAKEYTRGQIEKIAQAAFGPAFTIRSVKEIFLPVHSISVVNPDGTILTSYWNALSGQRIVKG
jgi:hypothetical protein